MNNYLPALTFFLCLFTTACVEWTACEELTRSDYEKITGIPIPAALDEECVSRDGIRISIFEIDTEDPDFLRNYRTVYGYLNQYKFAMIAAEELPGLNSQEMPKSLEIEIENQIEVLWKEGNNEGYKWQMILLLKEEMLIVKLTLEEDFFLY